MNSNANIIGSSWSFPPKFDLHSRSVAMVTGAENLKQSLNVLFGTQRGERILAQQYGCNLSEYLFRNITTREKSVMRNQITRAISLFEPRIILQKFTFDTSNSIEGELSIIIEWVEETTNTRNNMVFPFYTIEGTLLPKPQS